MSWLNVEVAAVCRIPQSLRHERRGSSRQETLGSNYGGKKQCEQLQSYTVTILYYIYHLMTDRQTIIIHPFWKFGSQNPGKLTIIYSLQPRVQKEAGTENIWNSFFFSMFQNLLFGLFSCQCASPQCIMEMSSLVCTTIHLLAQCDYCSTLKFLHWL